MFLLNSDSTSENYARELTSDEIEDLPECIVYVGQPEEFKVDHKRAFELLVSMIFNMNLMQEAAFQSFPVASFVWHLSGYLYPQVMETQFGWVTCIVLSGAGNTCRTGKSLLTSMWQLVFDGFKSQEQGISISTAALFTKLDKGIPYYSKFFIIYFCLYGSSKVRAPQVCVHHGEHYYQCFFFSLFGLLFPLTNPIFGGQKEKWAVGFLVQF